MVDRYARLDNNQRSAGRRRAIAITAALLASAPTAMHAQTLLGPGISVTTTNLAPTTTLATDPVTGLTTANTERVVVIDVKHTDNPQVSMCTGETVLINGKQTFWFSITESSSGRVHEKFYESGNGTGDGMVSGAKYSFASTLNREATYAGPSLTTTNTDTVEQHLVRAGETGSLVGDDFFIKTVLHFTVVNNVPTATVTKIETPCR